jgi:hypothetical protein
MSTNTKNERGLDSHPGQKSDTDQNLPQGEPAVKVSRRRLFEGVMLLAVITAEKPHWLSQPDHRRMLLRAWRSALNL